MNDLGFWMAMFTLGALAYFETPFGRMIRSVVRSLWALGQDLLDSRIAQPRDQFGRWAPTGDLVTTGGNGQERVLPAVTSEVTALESGVTSGNDVTSEVTIHEAIFITAHLVQGVAPSNVTKQLPGFTPKRYGDFKIKVEQVRTILAEVETEENRG